MGLNKYGEIDETECPGCGSPVKSTWVACPECGEPLFSNKKKKDDDHAGNTFQLYCQVCDMDVTILKGSSPKVLCPHISRFDGYGWFRMDCKLQKSWGSRLKCGIYEGLK